MVFCHYTYNQEKMNISKNAGKGEAFSCIFVIFCVLSSLLTTIYLLGAVIGIVVGIFATCAMRDVFVAGVGRAAGL